jgi:hypothetical protein
VLNDDYLPREFLVTRARFFGSYEDMLGYMKTGEFDPGEEVLLLGAPERGSLPAPEVSRGQVEVLVSEPNRLAYKVETQDECYLVVSEVYYPGWRVFVDDTEQELLRADYAFRAIKLDPGTHTVRMTYTPIYFRIGLLLSIAGFGLLAVLIASRRRLAFGHEA